MSRSTHSYAPLDSTPSYNPGIAITQTHGPSSSPPPLYPNSRSGSHSPPRDASGYRPESMLYSKPSQAATSEASSTALLSQSERDVEKSYISASQDGTYQTDASYPPTGRSRSISPSGSIKSFHIQGKQLLSIIRILLAICNVVLSIIALKMVAEVFWGIYAKNKTNWQQPTASKDPSKPSPDRTYAFPQDINALPSYLIIATTIFSSVFNLIAISAPCWRSSKKFHKKRLAKSEIFEIICTVIIIAVGAAGVYLAITTKSDPEHSLWGFACDLRHNSAKYKQATIFANIRYADVCNNYEIGVYTLLVAVAFSASALATYSINFCLKKKKGEYVRDNSKPCMGACDLCGPCGPCGPCIFVDCTACCAAVFCCCELFT